MIKNIIELRQNAEPKNSVYVKIDSLQLMFYSCMLCAIYHAKKEIYHCAIYHVTAGDKKSSEPIIGVIDGFF